MVDREGLRGLQTSLSLSERKAPSPASGWSLVIVERRVSQVLYLALRARRAVKLLTLVGFED